MELRIVSWGCRKQLTTWDVTWFLSVSYKIHTDIKNQSYCARLSYFHTIVMVAYDEVQVGSLVSIQTQTVSWLENSDVNVACFEVWEKKLITLLLLTNCLFCIFFKPWAISKAPNQQHLLYLTTFCLHFALTGTFCGSRKRLQAPLNYGLFPFTTVVIFMRPCLLVVSSR